MPVYLSFGSNIGDRLEHLRFAIRQFEIAEQSSIYETEPVDFTDQPWFLNAVVAIRTDRTARGLLEYIRDIEKSGGRTRDIAKGPRTIDIDILFFDNLIVDESDLQIPHPRIPFRRFVLQPLAEIAADLIHPVLRKSIRQLANECMDQSIVRRVGSHHVETE